MKILNRNSAAPALSHPVKEKFQTNDDDLSPVVGGDQQFQEEWQEVINKLIDWGGRPSFIDEDDLESPSNKSINSCFHLVRALRGEMLPVPDRVVGDGEGGIVFELFGDERTETLEIDSDGLIEYMMFIDSRLVQRNRFLDG